MLGVALILIGTILLMTGALYASQWVDKQVDRSFLSLHFFSLVVGPLLGGSILVVFGLMEFS
ncbi:MAG: hypothetical protein KAR11_03880 [Phycisphaerae bacterium]|nr:hypothetical protein [Phycisphaerae bacterium]